MASNSMTDEQKKRMEANRLKALQIRRAREQTSSNSAPNPSPSPFSRPTAMSTSAVPSVAVTARNTFQQSPSLKRKAPESTAINAKVPVSSVKISLDSPDRLRISFPYKDAIISIIKTVKSCRYEPLNRKWTVSISDYANLLSALQAHGDKIKLDADSVPGRVISLIQSHMKYRETHVDLLEKFDRAFVDNLFAFQREGVIFGIQRNGKCLLADDMGLGKTVQALGIVGWYRTDWPVCIACPASVTMSWKTAILRWLGQWVKEHEIQILDSHEPSYGPKFFIGSYERLGKYADDFVRRKIPSLILDECHNIKSDGAKRTAAALKISKVAKRIILISGTPALSRPIELYTQLATLNEKLFTNKHEFGVRYCAAYQTLIRGTKHIWDYRGSSNADELRILLESTVMIRRLKVDVLKDLPPKKRIVVSLPLKVTEEERVELDKIKSKVTNRTHFHSDNHDLMTWYRETSRLKVAAVLDYLNRKLDRTGKIICFAHHRVMIDAIADFLTQQKVRHIIITGDTLSHLRQNLCDDFQENPSTKIALISILAAGVGITLTAANLVIFTELTWNPGVLTQAEDRAHRIGQEDKVTIEYLVSPDTCDEQLWNIIQRKLAVLGKVGLSKEVMKDSAQRDANQSLIQDYFSASPKAAQAAITPNDEADSSSQTSNGRRSPLAFNPTSAPMPDRSSASSSSLVFSTPKSSKKTKTQTSNGDTSQGEDDDIWVMDENDSWLDCIDVE